MISHVFLNRFLIPRAPNPEASRTSVDGSGAGETSTVNTEEPTELKLELVGPPRIVKLLKP
jgi:hypothetical protein